jgi:putative autoinducer-2 (AI-2) aldolase
MILRISGGATIVGPDITHESIVSSVDEALRINADAVSVNCFIGFENEHQTLENLGKISDECRKWNMPLAGVHAAGKDREKMMDPRLIALGARVLAELGADIVKTYYTPEGFDKVVAGCPVPVMIAGGPKCETDADTLAMIRSALDQGASGIVMGRNIWQTENPVRLIKIVRAMIHEDLKLDEGVRMLEG